MYDTVSRPVAVALLAAHGAAYSAHYGSKESAKYRRASDAYYKQMEITDRLRAMLAAAEQKQSDLYGAKASAYEAADATPSANNLRAVEESIRAVTGTRWLDDAFPILHRAKESATDHPAPPLPADPFALPSA